jgi:hypothetical protein
MSNFEYVSVGGNRWVRDEPPTDIATEGDVWYENKLIHTNNSVEEVNTFSTTSNSSELYIQFSSSANTAVIVKSYYNSIENVFAFNTQTGDLRWSATTDNGDALPAGINSNYTIIFDQDTSVTNEVYYYIYDLQTGERTKLTNSNLSGRSRPINQPLSNVPSYQDKFYVFGQQNLLEIDAVNGTLTKIDNYIANEGYMTPVIEGDYLYWGRSDNNTNSSVVKKRNLIDDTNEWETFTSDILNMTNIIVSEYGLFTINSSSYTSSNADLKRFDKDTGELKYSADNAVGGVTMDDPGYFNYSTNIIVEGDYAYRAYSNSGVDYVESINLRTNSIQWSKQAGNIDTNRMTEIKLVDNLLFISQVFEDGVLDKNTGDGLNSINGPVSNNTDITVESAASDGNTFHLATKKSIGDYDYSYYKIKLGDQTEAPPKLFNGTEFVEVKGW